MSALCLRPGSPTWPRELEAVEPPPEELWLAGRCELLLRTPRFAIVGTRTPTAYGEEQARRFARTLAAAGVVVVSGLARGVDQAAHAGALDVGGATIAVLGSGIDRPWPGGEPALRMASEGLLLTEFPPGREPRRHHFPQRNRLIAGLAWGVLVVEAAQASGSLITARWAVDQGKEVFALPGRVDHPMARGCHRLLREGARLVEDPEELLVELGIDAASTSHAQAPPAQAPMEELLTSLQLRLLDALIGDTASASELALRTRADVAAVSTALVELELARRVARGPGGLYRLA